MRSFPREGPGPSAPNLCWKSTSIPALFPHRGPQTHVLGYSSE